MFAYCNNSPIILSDESGHIPDPFSPVDIFGCHGRSKPATTQIPESIYTKSEGYIYVQNHSPCNYTPFGFGTYVKNGCGVIAVYNTMQLLGQKETLAVIDTEIFIRNGYSLGGLLGVTRGSIRSYFQDQGISCTGYATYAALSQNVREGSVIIVMVLNNANNIFDGAHYMAAQYINGQYQVYNIHGYALDSVSRDSLLSPYAGSWFLYGFIVGG